MFKLTDLRGRRYYLPKKDDDTGMERVIFEIRSAANIEKKAGGPRWRRVWLDPELAQEAAIRTDQIYLVEEVEND